jgi:hypothetical protein
MLEDKPWGKFESMLKMRNVLLKFYILSQIHKQVYNIMANVMCGESDYRPN